MEKYLLTGASGFLGRYCRGALPEDVVLVGRGESNTILCDLAVNIPRVPRDVTKVIHAAGLAHVDSSAEDFYLHNLEATRNLLIGLSRDANNVSTFVLISTVAVYGVESGIGITEAFPTIPNTHYGLTKLLSEYLVREWAAKNGVQLTILRLPLVAGRNAPGNLGRLVNSIKTGRYVSIGHADSQRSIVLAADVANLVGSETLMPGIFNLTDGVHPSRASLEIIISNHYGRRAIPSFPGSVAKIVGKLGDFLPKAFPFKTKQYQKLTATLIFDDEKARRQLGWNPHPVLAAKEWLG